MDRRYQVFVSSTFADLQEERQEVMQALLELDCIPAGMELFPAANEDQWTLIKKVIDDCDYYIVILAGRYGPIGPGGLSYTELEYRYALDTGKPVIAFLHARPETLPANRSEVSEDGRKKLPSFRDLVQQKMCRHWDSPADLGSQVSRSLIKLIKTNPAIGWVRGNLVPDESAAKELLALRRRIEELEAELQSTRVTGPEGTSNLAQGLDRFVLRFSFVASSDHWALNGATYTDSTEITWNDLFAAMSPLMIDEAAETDLISALSSLARARTYPKLSKAKDLKDLYLMEFTVYADDFQTIKIQLRALGLITKSTKNRSVKDTATYWTLTSYGDTVMTRLRAIQKLSGQDVAVNS